jgi:serine phosphatase RsbU (regulator of sigma subunit)/anti-sigma regulatory factor (Ser/Thr protein kinase)/CHASE3 domain sensor protein
LSIVPLVFLIALLVLTTLFQRASDQSARSAQRSTSVLAESDRIFNLLDAESRAIAAYVKTHRRQALAPFAPSAAAMPGTLRTLGGLVADEPDQARLFRTYARQTDDVAAIVRQYRDAALSGNAAALKSIQTSPAITARLTAWRATKTAFEERERAHAIQRSSDARVRFQPIRRGMFACAALGVLTTLSVALLFGLRLARRLRRLAVNAPRYAAGEPTTPIAGRDEIASIDRIYRDLTARLQRTLGEKEAALAAYEREHRVSSTLQRALLPQDFPLLPGLRIDAAYVPAGDGADIGGDWYDVFALSETAVGISVGDVAGHGLRAASRMGSVRQSIRTAARADDDPSVVLGHVNRVLCADESDAFVTAFFGVFDLAAGALNYAIAGHPPPLAVRESGEMELLGGDGLVLGVDPHAHFDAYRSAVGVGSSIVFYTDGLIEVEHDVIRGTRALEDAVRAELLEPSANVAEGIQRRIFERSKPHDDSAVLFVGTAPVAAPARPERHVWSFDATDEVAAARVKRAFLWRLAGFGSREWDLAAIEAIYGELASNIRRHTPGAATIFLEQRGSEAILRVEDRGAPFSMDGVACPDLLAESGRGLFMIRELALDVQVERTETGSGNCVSVVLPRTASEAPLVLKVAAAAP